MKYAHYDLETGYIKGFYVEGIHDNIPTPSISITEDEWQDCLANQDRRGVASGRIVEIEPEKPSLEQAWNAILDQRDYLLAESDKWMLPDFQGGVDVDAVREYRQLLRDYPTTVTDPYNPPVFPAAPVIPKQRDLTKYIRL